MDREDNSLNFEQYEQLLEEYFTRRYWLTETLFTGEPSREKTPKTPLINYEDMDCYKEQPKPIWSMKPPGYDPEKSKIKWYWEGVSVDGVLFSRKTGRSSTGKNKSNHGYLNRFKTNEVYEAWYKQDQENRQRFDKLHTEVSKKCFALHFQKVKHLFRARPPLYMRTFADGNSVAIVKVLDDGTLEKWVWTVKEAKKTYPEFYDGREVKSDQPTETAPRSDQRQQKELDSKNSPRTLSRR